MTTKALTSFLLTCALMVGISQAGDKKDGDKKWAEVVEKMITSGLATISTPKETRAKLAKEIAEKHGRKTKIEPIENGYRIVID